MIQFHLHKKTLSGKPAAKVNLILKTMGNSVNEEILELTDEQLVLLDGDGETKYTWTRVYPADEAPNSGSSPSRLKNPSK